MVRLVHNRQEELDFTAKPAADPSAVASIDDVEKVVAILKANGLQTAAQICAKLGLEATETSKRKVRAVAKAARPHIVSFPNSKGYKLAADCSVEEIWAWISSLEAEIVDRTQTKKLALDYYYSRGGK